MQVTDLYALRLALSSAIGQGHSRFSCMRSLLHAEFAITIDDNKTELTLPILFQITSSRGTSQFFILVQNSETLKSFLE